MFKLPARIVERTCIFAAFLGGLSHAEALLAAPAKSKVIVARDERAINDRNQADAVRVTQLFERSLLAFTGKNSATEAWRELGLAPSDVVAIKVNCNAWTVKLSPHPELVNAITKSLATVISENQIIVYEASTADLKNAGFTPNRSDKGVRFFGADEGGGFDSEQRLTNIITRTATKIINLASIKAVDGSGIIAKVTGLLASGSSDGFGLSCFFKNHVGSLMKQDRSKCHTDLDFLAEVAARPAIRQKTLLLVADGLRATYRRGVPWYWAGIIMAKDPVAADTVAFQVVNEKRAQEKIHALELPSYLHAAEDKYHLGTCNADGIERVNLEPPAS
jgi:hypothetical protein